MLKALLIVDIQNDFMPNGSLAVAKADEIVPLINELQDAFNCVIASKDWHPENHASFAAMHQKKPGDLIQLDGIEQILWPIHCVQNSPGSDFFPSLETDKIQKIFYKGVEQRVDSYSCFFDNARKKDTGLHTWLSKESIAELFICGLASDYCVKYTVLDALSLGIKVNVIEDACRAVNKTDGEKAMQEMSEKGASILNAQSLLSFV